VVSTFTFFILGLLILVVRAWCGRMLSRPEGTVLLLGYFSYMAWIWP
jgi:hypothetical protein